MVAGIVVMFGIFLLQGLYNLLGVGLPQHTPVLAQENASEKQENIRTIQKTIPHYGFMFGEKEIILESGNNYLLSITPEETGTGCSESFVIPGIDERIHSVRKGRNISIPVYDAQTWTYPILCAATGTVQAKIIIN